MDFSWDCCMIAFTPGQTNQMQTQAEMHRGMFPDEPPVAVATSTTGSVNDSASSTTSSTTLWPPPPLSSQHHALDLCLLSTS
mmetsp:Transcript_45772/g.139061  ORF Transcript_45772/g.139061 Transcript_45772/m.139061 type:complete len:82 (-) Transcript_45772:772-1017(-)